MNATIEQLQSLKLFGMLDAWVEQQSLPSYHDLSFDERLALLVEREHLRGAHLRQQRRLKAAQLPLSSACLEAIDYARPRGLSKAQVLQLAQGHWLAQYLQPVRATAGSERRHSKLYSPLSLLVKVDPTTVNTQKLVQCFLTQLL